MLKQMDRASAGQADEYWNNLVLGIVCGTIAAQCPPSERQSTVELLDLVTGLRLVGAVLCSSLTFPQVDKLGAGRGMSGFKVEVWISKCDQSE